MFIPNTLADAAAAAGPEAATPGEQLKGWVTGVLEEQKKAS